MKNFLVIVGIVMVVIGLGLWKSAERDFINDTGITCPNSSNGIDCAVLKVEQMEREQRASAWIIAAGVVIAGVSYFQQKKQS